MALALGDRTINGTPSPLYPTIPHPLLFHSPQGGGVHLIPFLQLMGVPGSGARISSLDADPYVLEHATLTAALLLAADATITPAASMMLAFVMNQLRHGHGAGGSAPSARQAKTTEAAVSALKTMLGAQTLRDLFVEVSWAAYEAGVRSSLALHYSTNRPCAAATRRRLARAAAGGAQCAAALRGRFLRVDAVPLSATLPHARARRHGRRRRPPRARLHAA